MQSFIQRHASKVIGVLNKEETARKIAERDGVKQGLICVLTCTEPCYSYRVSRNREKRLLELHGERLKCLHQQLFADLPTSYYWSIDESEWATDIMFRSSADLAALYPSLIRHGISTLGSPDVMRFLGRKLPRHGGIHGCFKGEVVSDLKTRPEGIRIKHRLNFNSIKMYDKQGSVLRVETTINDARDLKVYRRKKGDPQGKKRWLRMRKSVADVSRRARVSQAANDRYLKALAAVEPGQPLGKLTSDLCQPVTWQGRRTRALNPFAGEDGELLAAVSRGEFTLNGFRNRDLRVLLYGNQAATPEVVRRQSSAVTRRLRLLRAHRLISKVTKTHRYTLTDQGRLAITALLTAKQADAAKLNQLAA